MRKERQVSGYQKGIWAEALAALYFSLKGYRVLARRYKTPLGEIDLVARRGGTLVFIEVKLRKSSEAAAQAIHAKNQERVRQAATLYLQRHPRYSHMTLRFDALVMERGSWPVHIEGAF